MNDATPFVTFTLVVLPPVKTPPAGPDAIVIAIDPAFSEVDDVPAAVLDRYCDVRDCAARRSWAECRRREGDLRRRPYDN